MVVEGLAELVMGSGRESMPVEVDRTPREHRNDEVRLRRSRSFTAVENQQLSTIARKPAILGQTHLERQAAPKGAMGRPYGGPVINWR